MSKRNHARERIPRESNENSLECSRISSVNDSICSSKNHSNRSTSRKNAHVLGDKTNEVDSFLYQTKIKELEEINSKLFDPKMAFNYNFMNGLNCLIKNPDGGIDFKIAAEALDAATKIYTSRVDIVQKQTQQIATRFAINSNGKDKNQQKERKKKDLKHMEEYTRQNLAKNSSLLNGKIPKNLIADPLYDRLSSAYDVANVSVLMTRQMFLLPNGVFALNSSDSLNFSSSNCKIDSSKKEWFPYPFKKSKDIDAVHAALRNFDFHDRKVDMEEMINQYKAMLKAAQEERNNADEDKDVSILEYVPVTPTNICELNDNWSEVQLEDLDCAEDFEDLQPGDGDDNIEFEKLLADMSMHPSVGGEGDISGDFEMGGSDNVVDDTEIFDDARSESNKEKDNGTTEVMFEIHRVARQVEFMMNIFDRENSNSLVSRKFLKNIFSKVHPDKRPKSLYDDERAKKVAEETVSTAKKSRLKKTCEPLVLYLAEPKPTTSFCQNLSQTSIKKRVRLVNSLTRRPPIISNIEDLFRSFWNPKLIFKLSANSTDSPHMDMDLDNNSDDDNHLGENDSFIAETMDLSLNDSVPLNLPTETQPLTGIHTEYTKMPRYVTDFGENMDPFGLGEQNREFAAPTQAIDDVVPVEEKALEYTTKMKKINIKKLKKLIFTFCEQFSMKKSEFDSFVSENSRKPENCLTFFELIYHVIYDGNLDEQTLEDLTIPIFFVATLHLCNDKRLLLIKTDDKSGNFYIVFLD